LERIVDCVIWPMKHSDVELIVKAANECNVRYYVLCASGARLIA
jgi:hypothetical protein